MSDVMLLGVLRMPPECWTGDPVDEAQRFGRYKQAAHRIESDAARISELEAIIEAAQHGIGCDWWEGSRCDCWKSKVGEK